MGKRRNLEMEEELGRWEPAKIPKKSKMSKLIKALQGSNFEYRVYKHLQRSAIVHNPKFLIAAVLTLAIVSNTIFSLAFITFLSYAMLRYRLFLEVGLARFVLCPIIQNIMMPLVLLEILLHIAYQIPVEVSSTSPRY